MTATVPAEPILPDGAGIPTPRTTEQGAALGVFLTSGAEHNDWGREGWRRVVVGKEWCENPNRR